MFNEYWALLFLHEDSPPRRRERRKLISYTPRPPRLGGETYLSDFFPNLLVTNPPGTTHKNTIAHDRTAQTF